MMNRKRNERQQIPPELAALLKETPPVSEVDLDRLSRAGQELDQDPAWRAELLKGFFIEKVLEAMEEKQVTQAQLAAHWGKSRQYLSKLLNEDKRVNFTIETMCEFAQLLDRRLEIHVLRDNESARVWRSIPPERRINRPEAEVWRPTPIKQSPFRLDDLQFPESHLSPRISGLNYEDGLAA